MLWHGKATRADSDVIFSWDNLLGQRRNLTIQKRLVGLQEASFRGGDFGSCLLLHRSWTHQFHFSCFTGGWEHEIGKASPLWTLYLCILGGDSHWGGVRRGLVSQVVLLGSHFPGAPGRGLPKALYSCIAALMLSFAHREVISYWPVREHCRREAAPASCICFSTAFAAVCQGTQVWVDFQMKVCVRDHWV